MNNSQLSSLSLLRETWRQPTARCYLLFSIIASLILLFVFKHFYPHPNFLPDSFTYLDAASKNVNIMPWPIGYPKFLRLVHSIHHSDTFLIFTQYILLEIAIIYLLLTIHFLLNPGKLIMIFLFIILLLNPVILQLSNLIASDAVFSAISLIWATQLMWIIKKPTFLLLIVHAITLLFAFMFRYNALWYPFISITAIFITKIPEKTRYLGIALVISFPSSFIIRNIYYYQQETGVKTYSPFGGWQLASNGMNAYAHVTNKPVSDVPEKFRLLHSVTNRHMDSIKSLPTRPDSLIGIYYLWENKAPLRSYMFRYTSNQIPYINRWTQVSGLYGSYGAYLITQYPSAYAEYYLFQNLLYYYTPPPEYLAVYNMGKDYVEEVAKQWFQYPSNKIRSAFKDEHITSVKHMPVIAAIINFFFVVSFMCCGFLEVFKRLPQFSASIIKLSMFIWMGNFLFSVFASPIVLRYQVFPIIISLTFGTIILRLIIKEGLADQQPILHPSQTHQNEYNK